MSPLLNKVARNLAAQRKRLRLSQAAVAERAHVSVSYVSMLERGQRSPPIEKLAQALRVTPTSLLT